jgi:hypothetical protein
MFSDFSPENRSVYEIMWKNMVELEGPQTIWGLRVAYWMSKPTRAEEHSSACAPTHTHTHTHTQICKTYCSSTTTTVL